MLTTYLSCLRIPEYNMTQYMKCIYTKSYLHSMTYFLLHRIKIRKCIYKANSLPLFVSLFKSQYRIHPDIRNSIIVNIQKEMQVVPYLSI